MTDHSCSGGPLDATLLLHKHAAIFTGRVIVPELEYLFSIASTEAVIFLIALSLCSREGHVPSVPGIVTGLSTSAADSCIIIIDRIRHTRSKHLIFAFPIFHIVNGIRITSAVVLLSYL